MSNFVTTDVYVHFKMSVKKNSQRKGWFHEKNVAVLLDFVKIASPPSLQFGQLVPLFLNAKNVDLRYIQNDSLSKILLK